MKSLVSVASQLPAAIQGCLPNLSIEIFDPAARLWYICAERGSFLFHFIDVSLDPLLPFCFRSWRRLYMEMLIMEFACLKLDRCYQDFLSTDVTLIGSNSNGLLRHQLLLHIFQLILITKLNSYTIPFRSTWQEVDRFRLLSLLSLNGHGHKTHVRWSIESLTQCNQW